MFTGIIEASGTVRSVRHDRGGLVVCVEAKTIARELNIGDSITVNGACLTVIHHDTRTFTVEIVEETIRRTTLGGLRVGDRVNLERALRLSDRLNGHLVQGHVDGVGRVVSKEPRGNSTWFVLEVPASLTPYLIEKGSIAVDGISLTIAERTHNNMYAVAIIPHTAAVTTFGSLQVGDRVNIEVDLLGKYVESFLRSGRLIIGEPSSGPAGMTEEWLKRQGI